MDWLGLAEFPYNVCDCIFLKQANARDACSPCLEAGCRIFERDSSQGKYRNRVLASPMQVFESRRLRIPFFEDRREQREVGSLLLGFSHFLQRMTGNSNRQTTAFFTARTDMAHFGRNHIVRSQLDTSCIAGQGYVRTGINEYDRLAVFPGWIKWKVAHNPDCLASECFQFTSG